MVLAFRLYGNFQWPPRVDPPGPHEPAQDPQLGLVEIYFDHDPAHPADPEYKAFLRWRPGPVEPDQGPSALPVDDVFSIADPIARLGRTDETLLWIFDPKKKGGRKLALEAPSSSNNIQRVYRRYRNQLGLWYENASTIRMNRNFSPP